MSLYDEILTDLTRTTDLSIILRKAKVLSYKLKNQEFKNWIENEFNGYADTDLLPQYRTVNTIALGSFSDRYKIVSDFTFSTHIIPEKYRLFFDEIHITQGIKELESMCEIADGRDGKALKMSIPPSLFRLLDYKVFQGMQCLEAWRLLSKSQVIQVIEATRNKLLDFILELADKYPEIKSDSDLSKPIPNEKIQQIFNYSIFGGRQNITGSANLLTQGDNMAVFDQRNQKVNTQYNAAGNINFNNVQDTSAFIEELQKLKAEFLKEAEQQAIDGEIVDEAERHLTKAIEQSQKSEPQKSIVIKHLETAKQWIDGVTVTTGLLTALTKAIEVANTIFN